jgi:DNA-binding LytR/AlgR family response regulator
VSCSLAIGELESRLDPALFYRAHRRFIVNLRQIGGVSRRGGRLSLVLNGEGTAEIPVSREAAAELRRRLGLSRG